MPRKKTVRAFEEWVKDPKNVDRVIERVTGGEKLEKICVDVKQPYTCLYPYLHSTPELKNRFDTARKARADSLVEKALTVVEEVEADKDEVAKAKLQSETYQWVAAKWDRDRYADQVRFEHVNDTPVDAALLGAAKDLLRLAVKKQGSLEKEIEGEVFDVTVSIPEAIGAKS